MLQQFLCVALLAFATRATPALALEDENKFEGVLIEQSTTASSVPLVWASFNRRSEARNPAAVAHEDKSPFDVVSIGFRYTSRARPQQILLDPGQTVLTQDSH